MVAGSEQLIMSTTRTIIVGRDLYKIEEQVRRHGFEIVEEDPDLVISNGGDGALLGAERMYPGVPKLGLRDSKTSLKHEQTNIENVLGLIRDEHYTINEYMKLEVSFQNKRLLALNDIMLRNEIPTSGIRFYVEINGDDYTGEIIGDGLIASTPVGSSAYYRSITSSIFQVGIGIAFNNSTEPINHLVLEEGSIIKVRITRGPALVAADNNPEYFHLQENDEIEITQAHETAQIISYSERHGPSAFTRLV